MWGFFILNQKEKTMTNEKIKISYVDEHVVRLIASQVIFVTALVLITQSYWLALALGADFALRAFTYITSPLAFVAKAVHKRPHWPDKPVFAPPKKFTATMGFLFSIAISALFYLHLNTTAYIIGAVLLMCAGLESFFNVCAGCYVYDWIIAPFKN